mmetsp:Transcript_16480/g.33649  ORF Transcript_16480/g.33649 Transcript_16480/m.33649 type:complete len:752 (-) Transcript_16480:238-2493(-)|eukprot:CAMPEP_0184679750 /NCGR_PEP_ID=MMETSP0312-20130426/2608_1 /TAXON_ID=31354 /ORGANISM="Compsopogon coeruleus, Strain SAG 36.94" /LENGTH=751 /DNA_ID=CAMNT_0027129399 /DNA_START=247 /DNA_END=2502 /DNA_ORIENTATION=+
MANNSTICEIPSSYLGKDPQSIAIGQTAAIGITVFLICLILFEILRSRMPTIFGFREYAAMERRDLDDFNSEPIQHPPIPRKGLFRWIGATLSVSHDQLVQTVGLDAASYLRLVRLGVLVFGLLTLVTSVVLFPIYATGDAKNNDFQFDDKCNVTYSPPRGIAIVSMSNLNPGSPRLWGAWLIDFLMVYVVLYLLYQEIAAYTANRRRFRAQERPTNYTVLVWDVPNDSWADDAVKDFFDKEFPGDVVAAHVVRTAPKIAKLRAKHLAAVSSREVAEWNLANNPKLKGDRPVHKPGCCSGAPPVDSIDYWQGEQDRLANEIAEAIEDPDRAKKSGAAFVTFRTKRAATFAAQTQVWEGQGQWVIQRALDPSAIAWPGLTLSRLAGLVMTIHTYAWLFVFLAFWAVITTAVLALGNLSSIARIPAFSWLQPILDLAPTVTAFIEGVLPPIILIVMNMLPLMLLQIFSRMERFSSIPEMDVRFRNLGYAFQFINTFLVVVVSGSFLDQVDKILKSNLSEIIDLLAHSVPTRVGFYINYTLSLVFIGRGIELLQIVRVLVKPILGKVWKTTRQQRNIDKIGSSFLYPSNLIAVLLVFTIVFIYSTLAPLICFFGFLYFGVTFLVQKHNLAFTFVQPFEGGGIHFVGAVKAILFAMVFKQIFMIGLFGLNKVTAVPILEAINLIPLFGFIWYHGHFFGRVIEHGALTSVTASKEIQCPPNYEELYVNPDVTPLQPVENLSGVVAPELPTQGEVDA